MKKIFALALAAVMTAGMTTVAFADTGAQGLAVSAGGTKVTMYYDKDGKDGIKSDETANMGEKDPVAGGKTLYVPIYTDGHCNTYATSDDVEGWRVEADWEVGKPASKPEITSVKIDGSRTYAIAVELPEAEATAKDLVGTITLYSTRSGDVQDKKDSAATKQYRTVDVSLEYGYKTEDYSAVSDFADAQIVDFDECDGEEILDFGEYMSFEVNLDGQGKLNLKNNTAFDSEIADRDKSANMDFITFVEQPSFNKIGTAYIYAADDTFLYEVKDGKLVAVDASYNEDYEAWEFKTRTLGEYVISDKELDLDEVNTVEDDTDASSSTTDGGKKNPDTGR